MSTMADVLDWIADVIAERGLSKRDYEGPGGTVCAVGAIRVAIAGGPRTPLNARQFDTYRLAHDWASDVVGNAVARWNDAPKRTADEVIAALREAARRERGAA
jgi:putative intracellular protease/amidase